MRKICHFILFLTSLYLVSCLSVQTPINEQNKVRNIWSKRVTDEYLSGNLAYNRKTAHIDSQSQKVFAAFGEKTFKAYDLSTGKVSWERNHEQRIVSSAASGEGNVFYGLENGDFLARDLESGKLNYKVTLSSAINSRPVVEKGKIFISLEEHGIVCLEAHSGELLWSYQRPLSKEVTLSKGSHPIVLNELLITGFDDGAIVALNIFNGAITWQKQIQRSGRFLDLDLKPLYTNRKLYVGGLRKSFIMDAKSGAILKTLNYGMSSNPIAFKDYIFFGKNSGHIEFITSTGKFSKRVQVSKEPIVYANLLSPEQILVISQDGRIRVLNAHTMNLQESIKLGHPDSNISDDISVENGYAAIMSTRYRLYVLKSTVQKK